MAVELVLNVKEGRGQREGLKKGVQYILGKNKPAQQEKTAYHVMHCALFSRTSKGACRCVNRTDSPLITATLLFAAFLFPA